MVKSDFSHVRIEGVMHLVFADGSESSFSIGVRSLSDARFECRDWLIKRPDAVFVSIVCGRILVASAGVFPMGDFRVSLAALGC